MTSTITSLADQVMAALDTVVDPELDEPVTDLGFVRSVDIDDVGVAVHLRLPTSFCSPNFAYLMASDARDALQRVPDIGHIVVELDDHHDSDKINAGLAAEAGYRGTFGSEAQTSLDDLRAAFKSKAHTAAMERSLQSLLRTQPSLAVADLGSVRLGQLPAGRTTDALVQRRAAIGLSTADDAPVMVTDEGRPVPAEDIPMKLKFARAARVSIEGNSHFCRGLLATRYSDDEAGDMSTRVTDSRGRS
ncbi:iron-sulfur cluster assembly protein [Dietzia sp. PP-33]|jgi:metal-sulfur cluster biosynthetic enzyme|uniref:metal-sulfur cluster assembly factor n=1 Tax=Dietzia sp. PP-33 TaxID=2957500 RepID=UPI0029B700E5|nr:iron-sulfur cluster assembly protein [Dietzia sp. PP-33]MDX2357832.1 iron-sulfur cluster assembly protein [Dietzia sp. PP-33]